MTNFYTEIRFFLQFLAVAALYRLSAPSLSVRNRKIFILTISLFFLSRLEGSRTVLAFIPLYVGLVYLLRAFLVRASAAQALRKVASGLSVSLLVAILIVLKYRYFTASLVGWHESLVRIQTVEWVGLSYLTMRAIDYLLTYEFASESSSDIFSLSLYLCFFASFVSGPIQRFTEFSKDFDEQEVPRLFDGIGMIVLRIFSGIIKVMFLGRFFLHASVLSPSFFAGSWPWLKTATGLYSYLFYIYFDFSGYCDCAIAIASFFNLKVPENFHFPIFSPNLQEYWNRWHISLSHWCRDHVFYRLLRFSDGHFSRLPLVAQMIPATLITFALIGAWHGDSWNWLFYGIYQGVGLSIFIIYRAFAESYFPCAYERALNNYLYRGATAFLTFNFVSWGLLLTLSHAQMLLILKPLWQ